VEAFVELPTAPPDRPPAVVPPARPSPPRIASQERRAAPPAEQRCRIAYWSGYTKSRFVAVGNVAGDAYAVAESEPFKWRGAEAPERRPDIVAAHEALVAELVAHGWEVTGEPRTWFAQSFSRRRRAR
jgi:hypothetical protein